MIQTDNPIKDAVRKLRIDLVELEKAPDGEKRERARKALNDLDAILAMLTRPVSGKALSAYAGWVGRHTSPAKAAAARANGAKGGRKPSKV